MIIIVPLIFGSLPLIAGSAWLAAFKLGWQLPNLLDQSVSLSENMNFLGFLIISFFAWPTLGVLIALGMIKKIDAKDLAVGKTDNNQEHS